MDHNKNKITQVTRWERIISDMTNRPSVVKTLKGEVRAVGWFCCTCGAAGAERTRLRLGEQGRRHGDAPGASPLHMTCEQGEGGWAGGCWGLARLWRLESWSGPRAGGGHPEISSLGESFLPEGSRKEKLRGYRLDLEGIARAVPENPPQWQGFCGQRRWWNSGSQSSIGKWKSLHTGATGSSGRWIFLCCEYLLYVMMAGQWFLRTVPGLGRSHGHLEENRSFKASPGPSRE